MDAQTLRPPPVPAPTVSPRRRVWAPGHVLRFARVAFLLAMGVGSVLITRASLPYFFGDDLHEFLVEKLPLPHEEVWLAALHVHVIAMAGFSILIIGMLTRTALGHLGRPLTLDALMLGSYALVIVATAARLLALIPGEWAQHLLQCSAAAWVLAFGLYVWRFLPMMIRPRLPPPPALHVPITRAAK